MEHKGTVTLETPRLILRRFRREDMEQIYRNCWSDREVWKWTRYQPMDSIRDVAEKAKLFTKEWLEAYENPKRYSWAICLKDTGEVVGRHFGMHPDDELSQIEMAYELGRAWWNRGYITEATKKILDFYFREVGFCRVWVCHASGNPASGQVLRKCGMRLEGTLRQAHLCNNGIFDEVRYSILRADYMEKTVDYSLKNYGERSVGKSGESTGRYLISTRKILEAAAAQSALELGCEMGDFFSGKNKVIVSGIRQGARAYLKMPEECHLVSYGSNVVAAVREGLQDPIRKYLDSYPASHSFETPHLYVLNEALREHGLAVCMMAEYFLPDIDRLTIPSCDYEMRILGQKDFQELYLPEWSNTLCEKRKHLDVLGVGAYRDGRLVGLAGCSADCGNMWQIGVDVLPDFRRQGIAKALTARLTAEILERGKIPFYCAAWCNLPSVRNAVSCGYYPAWVEISAAGQEQIASWNRLES